MEVREDTAPRRQCDSCAQCKQCNAGHPPRRSWSLYRLVLDPVPRQKTTEKTTAGEEHPEISNHTFVRERPLETDMSHV